MQIALEEANSEPWVAGRQLSKRLLHVYDIAAFSLYDEVKHTLLQAALSW